MKKRILMFLALTLVMLLSVSGIPVNAAKKVEVTSLKKLTKELKKKSSGTIVFSTKSKKTITIQAVASGKNKKLVIDAPNAKIINKSALKSITVKNAKSFTEKAKGNKITNK